MPYEINSALERLEQNLKDLDSAKKQVEATVSASDKLQQVVSGYVKSLVSVQEGLKQWEKELQGVQCPYRALSIRWEDPFRICRGSRRRSTPRLPRIYPRSARRFYPDRRSRRRAWRQAGSSPSAAAPSAPRDRRSGSCIRSPWARPLLS